MWVIKFSIMQLNIFSDSEFLSLPRGGRVVLFGRHHDTTLFIQEEERFPLQASSKSILLGL